MYECNQGKVLGCDAGKLDLCLCKGESFFRSINWVKQVGEKTIPMPLRGYSAIMEVISGHNTKNEKVLELHNPDGIHLDNNKIIINIPYQVSDNFTWSKGRYRLMMISPTGLRNSIVKGKITISGSPNCCQ